MNTFCLDLKKNYQRPVIELYGVSTIIDTGAMIPTFSLPIPLLEKAFKAKLVMEEASFGGFGGKCEGAIYSLENFQVGVLNFAPLEVFVPKIPVGNHPFLMSASMLYGTEYCFNTYESKFMVTIPDGFSLSRDFRLKYLQGELYAQIDGVLLQDEIKPERKIDNYTQMDIEPLFVAENCPIYGRE